MGYCTTADLFLYGLPRGTLSNPGRRAASASAAANTVTLDQHAFALNDSLTLRAEGGGSLPAPLVEGVTYYAVPVTDDAFSVAATADGTTIDFTTPGSKIVVVAPIPYAAAIAFGAALIDDKLPAHIRPLKGPPYPLIVVMTNAELAIGKLLSGTGSGSKSLGEYVDAALKRLDRWSAGIPLSGADSQEPANVAVTATAPHLDRRGWHRFGCL